MMFAPPSTHPLPAGLTTAVASLLRNRPPWDDPPSISVSAMSGDGSLRRFFRLAAPAAAPLVAILPPPQDAAGLREAAAAWSIGGHLRHHGVPLPELYACDPSSGLLLCEDLGELSLHRLATDPSIPQEQPGHAACYRQAIRALLHMQLAGSEGFDPSWCWDSPHYDVELMLERESWYFLRACCRDFFGLRLPESDLGEECQRLALQAALAPGGYFLHRDCQSRNILVHEDRIRFIDWQGGRLGPLAYDLASLLIDPYVALPSALQETLLNDYCDELVAQTGYDPEQFRNEYECLALQRNLQICGAFAFLTQRRGRTFFRRYLPPALEGLWQRLPCAPGGPYPQLLSLVAACRERLQSCTGDLPQPPDPPRTMPA